MKSVAFTAVALMVAGSCWAKLPAPSDEAKAKAAETAAKAAHGGKVDAYKLCKSMDQVAATYFDQAKVAGKSVSAAAPMAACADPGAFVYAPPVAASGAAAGTVAAATPAAPAAPAVAAVLAGKASAATPAAVAAAPKK